MIKRIFSMLSLVAVAVGGANAHHSSIITGGSDHSLALCGKGQIFAWGYNKDNRLCLAAPNDTAEFVSSPCLVNTGNITFSQVSAGTGSHSVALSCEHVVYCWGNNALSQCGLEPLDSVNEVVNGQPIPVPCGDAPGYTLDGEPGGKYLGDVKMVTASGSASMALLNSGKVVIWGGSLFDCLLEEATAHPVYVRDASGNPIENVIYITGGDDNLLLIVGETIDSKSGIAYSVGRWNGRGGDGYAKGYIAAPVEIGDGSGLITSGELLTNAKTCALSDVAGFVVTNNGLLYGWGNGGWGCSNGLPANSTTVYAERTLSGQYEEISGDPYMSNVKQVFGGNGNGVALTNDGYVLYWGSNDAALGKYATGGVIPNSDYRAESSTSKTGPVFANYCAGVKGPKEVRVDDAVEIGRGDLFGYVIDRNGDCYVWGSSLLYNPKTTSSIGSLGLGKADTISTCLSKLDMPCKIADLRPEVSISDTRYICAGSEEVLDCGFTPFLNREQDYYFQWEKDGQILNTSLLESPSKSDTYNNPSIIVSEPGVYRVSVSYIGMNAPCDFYQQSTAEVHVLEYAQPIDTFVTTNIVANPEELSASESILFEGMVNDLVYSPGQKTSWMLYANEEGDDLLFDETIEKEVNGTISVVVPADKLTPGTDNICTAWLENKTSHVSHLCEIPEGKMAEGSYQTYGLILECKNDVELKSFDLLLKGFAGTTTAKITPVVYKMTLNSLGILVPDEIYKEGETQVISYGSIILDVITVDCSNLLLEGAPMGVKYLLGMKFEGNGSMGTHSVKQKPNNPLFVEPILDDNENDVVAIGATANSYGSQANPSQSIPYFNITFVKKDKDKCGRIPLTAKLVSSSMASLESVKQDDVEKMVNVYTINGILVRQNVQLSNALNNLRSGIYVVDGKEVYVNK